MNFTFLELDTHSDFAWWTLAVARTDFIRKVEGGWSRMLRDLLRMSLGGPSGMQTAGVPLIIEDKLAVVFAKLAYVLSDGDGLRQALQWNGANGVKPCFKHWNVVKKGHPMAEQGSYVDICCSSPAKFQGFTEARFGKHSDSGKIDCSILRFLFLRGTPKKGSSKARCNAESEIDLSRVGARCLPQAQLRGVVDKCVDAHRAWAAGEMTKTKKTDTQKCQGFQATPTGLLADADLRQRVRFLDVFRYDWAHTFLADSFVQAEMWALIEASEHRGLFKQADLCAFFQEDWVFPKCSGNTPKDSKPKYLWKMFCDTQAEKNTQHRGLRAGMSDQLALYTLLRHFVEARIRHPDAISAEVKQFSLVCTALDLVLAAKRGRIGVREAGLQLKRILEKYLAAVVDLRGKQSVTPKYHWAFDVADQLITDGYIVDAFTLERLHLRVKAVANCCKNLGAYEQQVMRGVVNAHVNAMVDAPRWSSTCHMTGPRTEVPWLPGVEIADHIMFRSTSFHVTQFVHRGRGWCVCVRVAALSISSITSHARGWLYKSKRPGRGFEPHPHTHMPPNARRRAWTSSCLLRGRLGLRAPGQSVREGGGHLGALRHMVHAIDKAMHVASMGGLALRGVEVLGPWLCHCHLDVIAPPASTHEKAVSDHRDCGADVSGHRDVFIDSPREG